MTFKLFSKFYIYFFMRVVICKKSSGSFGSHRQTLLQHRHRSSKYLLEVKSSHTLEDTLNLNKKKKKAAQL